MLGSQLHLHLEIKGKDDKAWLSHDLEKTRWKIKKFLVETKLGRGTNLILINSKIVVFPFHCLKSSHITIFPEKYLGSRKELILAKPALYIFNMQSMTFPILFL